MSEIDDYRDVFGREAESWRAPLGALRLTLWDDNPPEWQIERARDELEWLTRVLNGVPPYEMVSMKAMGEEEDG